MILGNRAKYESPLAPAGRFPRGRTARLSQCIGMERRHRAVIDLVRRVALVDEVVEAQPPRGAGGGSIAEVRDPFALPVRCVDLRDLAQADGWVAGDLEHVAGQAVDAAGGA